LVVFFTSSPTVCDIPHSEMPQRFVLAAEEPYLDAQEEGARRRPRRTSEAEPDAEVSGDAKPNGLDCTCPQNTCSVSQIDFKRRTSTARGQTAATQRREGYTPAYHSYPRSSQYPPLAAGRNVISSRYLRA
jgi:hypothetical protein